MAGCIPKHVACGWWNPEVDAVPPFIAGPTGCTLPVTNENRARLLAGGTLFRSIAVGLSTNDLQIRITSTGSPTEVTLEIGIDNIVQETHTVPQELASSPIISGIPPMRAKLNAESSLIIMPTRDVQTTGTGSIGSPLVENTWDSSLDDATSLDNVPAFIELSGGDGIDTDIDTLSSIRTGPGYTMVYIDLSEIQSSLGEKTTLGVTRYWNGGCWKSFDPVVPDCAGSPPDCTGGAVGDCP